MSAVFGHVDRDGVDCDCGVCASLVVCQTESLRSTVQRILRYRELQFLLDPTNSSLFSGVGVHEPRIDDRRLDPCA
jgi:hypothetical protein